jgi:iron complex outermembrane receptor protein
LYKNIEVVKITKLTTKGQNKQNLETKQSDNLNHDAGKFLSSLPEINGIRKAGNYATDPVLRGFKYEQLNIVIDGAAAAINACPSRMDPAVSQVNLNTVQEAEIYKGLIISETEILLAEPLILSPFHLFLQIKQN